MISFFENYKVIVPLIATFIGIIGTILIQFLIKFFDSSITKKKEINIFKARVEILIRKIEPALNIPITNQNEINKEVAIRSLKDSYMKLDIFKEMVNKCLECEEYSLNQSHLNVIKRINDLLWEINNRLYQVDSLKPSINSKGLERNLYIIDHNLKVYDIICKNLDEIKKSIKQL